jgi:hypothetical protein
LGAHFSPLSVGSRQAVLGCTQNLGGCGPTLLYQQHFFVNDPNGQVVCIAGASNTVNFF